MSGRSNMNPSTSPILEERRLYREFYSTIHMVRVKDLHLERGTVSVEFLKGGGHPRPEVPIPLAGWSFPPKQSDTDKNYLRSSWGVYLPQIGDTLLVGFDAMGNAFSLSYHTIDFSAFKRYDDANEERGGIGWGDASGKRLRPGDWSFKSARNCALYLGDRASLTAGPHSVTLDKPNGEVRIQSDLVHTRYGDSSEIRAGSARRILVPGVDSQESYIYDLVTPGAGNVGQEHTNYIRRASLTSVDQNGLLMVRTSEGQVVDDTTKQIVGPQVFSPDLSVAMTGTATRVLRRTFDDATGQVALWTELVDNLGNYGVSAPLVTGFQWFTPVSTWTVLNTSTSWTSTGTYDLTVGGSYSLNVGGDYGVAVGGLGDITVGGLLGLTAGGVMDLTSAGAMTLTAPSISLASGSISLGASPAVVTCLGNLTFEAPLLQLGTGAVEPLIKGTTFNTALTAYLTLTATTFQALSTATSSPPLTPLSVPFQTLATAAQTLLSALSGTLSTKSMTL